MKYNIIIKSGCIKDELERINPVLILLDQNVKLAINKYDIEYFTVEENKKNFDLYFKIIDIFEKYSIKRTDTVVIIGGGVLIDVASFAASTYKRGVKYVNVPTTTLSMIDSSVGSKNGLNYNGKKNIIGNIYAPHEVIIDPHFLQTLDKRNYNNGLAEAIKIGYLSNPQIIDELNNANLNIEKLIKLCINEKLKYVEIDLNDYGYRNFLNFGHTFGHALETITNFKKYYHGEAVSIGMVIASGYDQQLIKLLQKFNLPTMLPFDINIKQLITIMKYDKKNVDDKINIVLKKEEKQIVKLSPDQIEKLFNKTLVVNKTFLTKKIIVNKSKSHIHRLLALCLATKSSIEMYFRQDVDMSEDVLQSIEILKKSNAIVTYANNTMSIDATNIKKYDGQYYIYKSATTYRIFAPVLCELFGEVDIRLDDQLASRPHPCFAPYVYGEKHNIKIATNEMVIDGSLSSQFISGFIIAAIASNKKLKIIIENGITSKPYINMTIQVAKQFNAKIEMNENIIVINSRDEIQISKPFDTEIDYSSLAFFIVYNKLCSIRDNSNQFDIVDMLSSNSFQADSVILEILDDYEIDVEDCPDLLPILIVYSLFNKRGIKLKNTNRIKYKECDRVTVMAENFKDLEAIKILENEIIVKPVNNVSGRKIVTHGDHRIAMACAIVAPFYNGHVIIDDYTVVAKSFPTFFVQIGGILDESVK